MIVGAIAAGKFNTGDGFSMIVGAIAAGKFNTGDGF